MNLHCPFRKTLLARDYACEHSSITHLPTGCNIVCDSDAASADCNLLMRELIQAAQFVMRYQPDTDSLTHGKLLKIQYGGLKGLQRLVQGDVDRHQVENISALVQQAKCQYSGFENIHYAALLQDILQHQNRLRRK